MTVKELIEKLKQLPNDAVVEVASVCGWENINAEATKVTLTEDGTVEIFG